MASASNQNINQHFLEEALSTDVDESAVNAIVGTLENQLVTTPNILNNENNQDNIVGSVNISGKVSNGGGPIIISQKHGVANGEVINNNSVLINTDNKLNNNNNIIGTNGGKNNSSSFLVNQVTVRQTSNSASGGKSSYQNPSVTSMQQSNNQNISSYNINQNIHISSISNMPKSNEPIKLVYPSVGTTQSAVGINSSGLISGSGQSSTSSTVLNMNNRVSFTTQPLPNGSILAPLTSQSNIIQSSQSGALNTGAIGNTVRTSQPQPTLVIKNQVSMPSGLTSAAPGIVTMTKSLNQVRNKIFICKFYIIYLSTNK